MVGTALCNNLKNIRDGKNKTRPALDIKEIYEYDLNSTPPGGTGRDRVYEGGSHHSGVCKRGQ